MLDFFFFLNTSFSVVCARHVLCHSTTSEAQFFLFKTKKFSCAYMHTADIVLLTIPSIYSTMAI